MTRKVILYIATSLDGYIADEHGAIDWLTAYGEQDIVAEDESYQALLNRIDTVLLGRTTYDQIINEFMVEHNDDYYYENMKNYVFTNRPAEARKNVVFINGSVVDCVRQLKVQDGQDIWLIGGTSIITPLIEKDLIDEYQITIIPMMLGNGTKLFEKLTKNRNKTLKLTNSRAVGDMMYLTYARQDS
ncbi:dihydrofolate reductase [Weissella diestrammenae]|uniref:Dihydrofolate reductase n=1 Tax=Weissella diestrammenae TaxID=1162633 RepID=A0A7G9T5N0_9LACO|nr:dihydrofolate reductase family protein [Weissella diestrammenae]MCM0582231.1 dihydrofolate reductase [Weissella diestrammenae]QNN75405.1 dihydrofolate reductase [Weissella diestrammenae]